MSSKLSGAMKSATNKNMASKVKGGLQSRMTSQATNRSVANKVTKALGTKNTTPKASITKNTVATPTSKNRANSSMMRSIKKGR